MTEDAALLKATNLSKHYDRRRFGRVVGRTLAVDGVDVQIRRGTSVGIAGESGSGKSTLLRLLLGLEVPSRGSVLFHGKDVATADQDTTASYRQNVQMLFQDPLSAFDPRQRMWSSVSEPAWKWRHLSKQQRIDETVEQFERLGLAAGSEHKFPNQLSGGERQRAAMARSLIMNPEVILMDEPVTALDVSIRGSVINILRDLRRSHHITFGVVSHDLTTIYYLTDYLYVMLGGRIVEEGPTVSVIESPQHAYTRHLVAGAEDPLSEPEVSFDEGNMVRS
jgi:peptide/nickel transport system ATP-binding protein